MADEHDKIVQQTDGHEPHICKFFRAALKTEANDLHLKVGQPAKLRIRGELRNTTGEILTQQVLEDLVFEILTPEQKKEFLQRGTVDLAYELKDEGRFRLNVFRQLGKVSLAARRISSEILSFKDLNLPPVLEKIADARQGLVLAVGPTGCGKTTTIFSMINHINHTRPCHIITIEDPVEYLVYDDKAIVSQREIGIDVNNFDDALKYMVRQDPDVVVISEMRDSMTVSAAMRAAETGHLVLATMHSANASQAVERLLDLFPERERELVRQSLSLCLKAIISQVLIPSIKEGVDLIPAVEILIANPSVKKLIADGREVDLPTVIRSSEKEGMRDLNYYLYEMIQNGSIEPKEGYKYASNSDELKMMLKGIRTDTTGIL